MQRPFVLVLSLILTLSTFAQAHAPEEEPPQYIKSMQKYFGALSEGNAEKAYKIMIQENLARDPYRLMDASMLSLHLGMRDEAVAHLKHYEELKGPDESTPRKEAQVQCFRAMLSDARPDWRRFARQHPALNLPQAMDDLGRALVSVDAFGLATQVVEGLKSIGAKPSTTKDLESYIVVVIERTVRAAAKRNP